jgi:hypothetical protein
MRPSIRVATGTALAVSLTIAAADPACAAAEPARPEEPILRVVEHWRQVEERERTVVGWTAVGTGAALGTFAGVVLAGAGDDPTRRTLGYYGLAAGVGLGIGGVIRLLSVTGEHEQLAALARRGATPAALEAEWQERAEKNQRMREVGAIFLLVAGTLNAGLGVTLLAIRPAERDREVVSTLAGVGFVTAAVCGVAGAGVLTMKTPVEISYETYRETMAARRPMVSIRPQLVPLDGGGLVGLVGAF